MIVPGFEIVQGRPGGQIILGRGAEAERHRRRYGGAAGDDEPDARTQPRLNLAPQSREPGPIDEIGLVQNGEIGTGELVGEDLVERVVMRLRRVGGAAAGDRFGVGGEAPRG